ncbi:hypothetical protein Dimus_024669, partial [Dionaea muscipula]
FSCNEAFCPSSIEFLHSTDPNRSSHESKYGASCEGSSQGQPKALSNMKLGDPDL